MDNKVIEELLLNPYLQGLLASTVAKALESSRNIPSSANSALSSENGSNTKLEKLVLYKYSNEELEVSNTMHN